MCTITEACNYRHCADCPQHVIDNLTTKSQRTNGDRIRAMTNDELADFFFESPEIEFGVCYYCKNFGGYASSEPCKTSHGMCEVDAKNEAFKNWLKQPAKI